MGLVGSGGCGGDEAAPAGNGDSDAGVDLSALGGDRPVEPYVPASYRSSVPAPLLIVLHGRGVSGLMQEVYFHFKPLAEEYGFIYLTPNGVFNSDGVRVWNATDACCDFDGAGTDDSGYLRGLIDEAKTRFNIDPNRIYLVGHSNGGFMSYRMACDHADVITGIVTLAGATYAEPTDCKPSRPVAVAHAHGTADDQVFYAGGVSSTAPVPGAEQTVAMWASYDGCDAMPDTSEGPKDYIAEVEGAETTVSRYVGCAPGGAVELWSMEGAGHIPGILPAFSRDAVEFLFAHARE